MAAFFYLLISMLSVQHVLGLEMNINGTGFAMLNESYIFQCYVSPTANIRNVATFTRRGVPVCDIIKPCRVYNTSGYTCGCAGVGGNTTVYTLTISSVRLIDETSWICTHGTTDRSNPYFLPVYYPPSVPTVQPEPGFPWLERDDNRRLTCSVSDRGNPPCTYAWFRDGVEDSSQTSSSYTFSTLTYTDNGRRFSCQAQNAYTVHRHDPRSSRNLTLDVYYHPRLTLSKPGTITKREGERLDAIICTADSNPPNPTFRWTSNSSIQWTGGFPLQIPVLERSHHGTYTCTATVSSSRGNLTGTSQTNIIVNYAPDVKITGQAKREDHYMTITCEASGRPAFYSFHGFRHSWGDQLIRTVQGRKVKPDRYVWKMNFVSYEDSGVYQCSVDNGIPDKNNTLIQNSSASITVRGKPVITLESERSNTFGEEIGQQVTIYKTVFSLEDITKHQWMKNGHRLTDNLTETSVTETRVTLLLFDQVKVKETGYNFTLKVKTFQETDEGRYRLEVCNTFDCESSFTDLSVTAKNLLSAQFKLSGEVGIAVGIGIGIAMSAMTAIVFVIMKRRGYLHSTSKPGGKQPDTTVYEDISREDGRNGTRNEIELTQEAANAYEGLEPAEATPYAQLELYENVKN